ncbi:hypothetical protein ATCC90586_000115 [Pythium insidiosum]|nr:hypothetical protein ATCC90586_000115 [Pythium insidiosum]
MSASPSRAAFTTRFLPSDGIPAYNALLDSHLGKRREFLLGNRQSLRLLQQTGAIARVEAAAENPNQYVVHMRSDDRPRRSVGDAALRRAQSLAAVKTRRATEPTGDRSERDEARHESAAQQSEQQQARQEGGGVRGVAATRSFGRSQSTTALFGKTFCLAQQGSAASGAEEAPAADGSTSAVIDRLRRRRRRRASLDESAPSLPLVVSTSASSSRHGDGDRHTPSQSLVRRPAPSTLPTGPSAPAKRESGSVVERLLENDAAFQLQIQLLRDEMRALESEKALLDAQIATARKRLRGVNAVHENDVAVAHCCAIMQQRLAKAEEEYMKSVTAQQQVKTDIDTLRRELLAMRKVTRKLEDDIAGVATANAAIEDKIRAAKATRNQLSAALVELERQAEIAAVEQRLKLPPAEDVVVDPEALMNAVQRRDIVARSPTRRRLSVATAGPSSDTTRVPRLPSERRVLLPDAERKPLLPFRSAFRVLQQTLRRTDDGDDDHEEDDREDEDVDAWVQRFAESEDQLLSQHNANVQLQDEVAQLEREVATLAGEAEARRATIRSAHQAALTQQHELQTRVEVALTRIESFNSLRELRNQEQARLRGIMQRCLEIMHAEKLVSHQDSLGGPLLLSELSSPAMLEALQKKMTEVAIMLKLTRHTAKSESESGADSAASEAASAWQTTGKNMRRSNLFAKREAASKIVLGPKEPSGTAHTAIVLTAQPPTVEGAQALAETYAAAMHQLHPSVIPHAGDAPAAPAAAAAAAAGGRGSSSRPTRLTMARAASIRAGKRTSAAVAFGAAGGDTRRSADASRRVSAPLAAISAGPALQPPSRARTAMALSRVSGGSCDSMITAEDAMAQVIEHTDELDA